MYSKLSPNPTCSLSATICSSSERHTTQIRQPPLGINHQASTMGSDASEGLPSLRPGVLVEVHGLESENGRLMNGKRGTIKQHFAEKGRFEVELGSGKLASLRPENLRRVEVKSRWAQASEAGETAADPAEASLPFKPGQRVEVVGLESESGKQMNGKSGIVTRYLKDKCRFQVELGLANLGSLRAENLKEAAPKAEASPSPSAPATVRSPAVGQPSADAAAASVSAPGDDWPEGLAFKAGHCVEVFGLDSELGRELNGEKGIVVSYDKAKDRIGVRVGDEVKNIRCANLKKVDFSFAAAEAGDAEAPEAEAPEPRSRSRSRSRGSS
ncbi:unnamed protein product [Polarella glacialis]|uniref:Uncharacterized protein n=1 Tax=Polarella glacialis TaxID=89957 RepID=A0A813LKW8_POLGL|nr:unnamed protein product [Polarella glacialis]CAE8730584.1 unnamed protein product [Polarella glacialis]